MKYTVAKLLELLSRGEQFKYIFFWGHRPARDGSITKSCFSQWWEEDFIVDEQVYKSAEHWMMAEKARLFNDFEILDLILRCESPAEAKKLGRKVRNFVPKIWDEHKFQIVVQGNLHKFGQNPDLGEFLRATGSRVLVEASPYDKIWGIGMQAKDEGIEYPGNWKGQNLLGFALMEVRDQL